MSVRLNLPCRFGYHRYLRVVRVRNQESPWLISWTNTVCLRCGERSWFNYKPYGWLTEDEWCALPDALKERYEASDESTIWYRPRATGDSGAVPDPGSESAVGRGQ